MNRGRRARTEDQKGNRRTDILQAALMAFSSKGYSEATIADIADDAQLTAAAVYRYFNSKVEIYRELNITGLDIFEDEVIEAFKPYIKNDPRSEDEPFTSLDELELKNEDYKGQIATFARTYVDFFINHREYYDVMEILHLGQKEFFSNERKSDILEKRAATFMHFISEILKKGAEAGDFKSINPFLDSVVFWAMIDGVLLFEVKRGTGYLGLSVEVLFERTYDMITNGLFTKK